MSHQWSKLRPVSKLEQLAETIQKTAFLLSDNHDVIQSYVNHTGANFRVINRVGESEFDVLCKQINIEKTNYAFVKKSDLERGLRKDLWIGLVLYVDGAKPEKFLFPSTVWNDLNNLFTDSTFKHHEYGINLNKETIHILKEEYSFAEQIQSI